MKQRSFSYLASLALALLSLCLRADGQGGVPSAGSCRAADSGIDMCGYQDHRGLISRL